MKFFLALIFTTFIITNGHKLAPYRENICGTMVSLQYNLQTTVLDLDGNSDENLMECVLKNVHNHSIVLITGYFTYSNPLLRKHKKTETPNIIIITKNITLDVIYSPSARRVLHGSHRALVYVTVTDVERFKCIDGHFNATDFLLLKTFMNKIWHHYKIMRVAVVFPLTCREKVAIYSGKRKTDDILYDRNIKLIDSRNFTHKALLRSGMSLTESYPLKANVFYRFPTSITECENLRYYTNINLSLTEGYCGLDALVMHDIVKHFKFNLHYPKDDHCYSYGFASATNVTGSLGCIVRKELDISFNSRFMTMYSEDYVYFLHYITTDSLCALIKRVDKIPIWFYAVSAFRRGLWCVIVALIIAIGLLTWLLATVKRKISGKKRESCYFYIQDALTSILFGFSLKKNAKLHILRGACLFSSIMFTTIYQSHVNYVFTTLLRFDTIRTLDELYSSENVLYMTTSMSKLMEQLQKPENDLQHNFLIRARPISDNHTLEFLLQVPDTALLGRKNDDTINILSHYMDENNSPMINIIDQCFNTYYLSFITRSGFPFYEEMQRFMQRIDEAGLRIIYHKWTCDMLGVSNILPDVHREPRPFAKITLRNQRIAFGILIFGYILSLIVFIIEIIRGSRRSHIGAQVNK